ncbi:MAG: hypothetical protein SGJ18_16285 [Pseudomonadota bacterium]|nr:hypothetical protein [Pseudomonadota bacterium]
MTIRSAKLLIVLGITVNRIEAYALSCPGLFLPKKTFNSISSKLWPEQNIHIPARKVTTELRPAGERQYSVDNTVYDMKGIDFFQSGLTVREWELLPLRERSEIDRNGSQRGLAVMGSYHPMVLQFQARPGEKITLVYESPRSDRTQFDIFNSGNFKEYMFPPREFKFVKAQVNPDGTISTLDGAIELIGLASANRGRVQAVLREGEQVELIFETPTELSNRQLYKSWMSNPRSASIPYAPHRAMTSGETHFTGVVGPGGDIQPMLGQQGLKKISIQGQQKVQTRRGIVDL